MTEIQEWGAANENEDTPTWQPLSSIERRVAGVLIEKAKTTPDAYPLSLNALTNGCNQKSNRSPQMNVDVDDVEDAVENLRLKGAMGVIQGTGRVVKYRHYMKEWLRVDGNELAVMAELLLRGPQTVGELRGRAARMSAIPDLGALRPVLQSLIEKNLVVELTPEGRGQIVTHGIYPEKDLERIRHEHGSVASPEMRAASSQPPLPAPPVTQAALPESPERRVAKTSSADEIDQLREEVDRLRQQVSHLQSEVGNIWSNLGQS